MTDYQRDIATIAASFAADPDSGSVTGRVWVGAQCARLYLTIGRRQDGGYIEIDRNGLSERLSPAFRNDYAARKPAYIAALERAIQAAGY